MLMKIPVTRLLHVALEKFRTAELCILPDKQLWLDPRALVYLHVNDLSNLMSSVSINQKGLSSAMYSRLQQYYENVWYSVHADVSYLHKVCHSKCNNLRVHVGPRQSTPRRGCNREKGREGHWAKGGTLPK